MKVCPKNIYHLSTLPPLYLTYIVPLGLKKIGSLKDAFESSNCEYGTRMKVELGWIAWRQLKQWAASHGSGILDIQSDKKLKRLLKSGDAPKCEIREVEALQHPARWYQHSFLSSFYSVKFFFPLFSNLLFICKIRYLPPPWTSYALVAKQAIAKREAIGFYIGTLVEVRTLEHSKCTITLLRCTIGTQDRRHCRPGILSFLSSFSFVYLPACGRFMHIQLNWETSTLDQLLQLRT